MTMMKAILTIALTLAISIALTNHMITKPVEIEEASEGIYDDEVKPIVGRVSRFLAERNPRAADHCHKDGQVCAATNTTCCNNKCIDLHSDTKNCGACKKKCKYTYTCCRGQCVDIDFDNRHCGACNNKCKKGDNGIKPYCLYGLCDYA